MSNIDDVINTLSSDELDTLNSDPQLLADFKKKYSDPAPQSKGMLGQAWEDLKVPEEKSREGLNMIVNAGVRGQNWLANKTGLPIGTEPTGNMARDMAANTPRMIGESVAQVAPSFVSRGAIVTGGLLKAAPYVMDAVGAPAEWAADQAGKQSGLINKGKNLLKEAFQKPLLMFGRGKDAANAMYSEVQGPAGLQIGKTLASIREPGKFVDKALELADSGGLGTDEALMARRELDAMQKTVTKTFYRKAREVFDNIAKQDYTGADEAYHMADKSEALRSLSAINKTGKTQSALKGAAMLLKPATSVLYSPIVQSGIASTLGAAYKGVNAAAGAVPEIVNGIGIADNLKKLMGDRKKTRPDPEFSKINGKIQETR